MNFVAEVSLVRFARMPKSHLGLIPPYRKQVPEKKTLWSEVALRRVAASRWLVGQVI
ncbi:MAG: hypothetical protein GX773_08110 [Chloroflexi bacterium]|nr:hypothetical protein [Chloroflexota bacterium]